MSEILNNKTVIDFTKRLARELNLKPVRTENLISLSAPVKSATCEIVFYEFRILKSAKELFVTITLCQQFKDVMKRVEVIYINGYVVEGSWVPDVEYSITELSKRFAQKDNTRFKNMLLKSGIIDEQYDDKDLNKLEGLIRLS